MLLDFLFPKTSLRGREGAFITEQEAALLVSHPRFFGREELHRRDMTSLHIVRIASTYSDCPLLRKAIWTLKYRSIPALADHLGELLVPLVPEGYCSHTMVSDVSEGTDGTEVGGTSVPSATLAPSVTSVLCPVPLFCLRRFSRGFNQAELLACAVSARTGIPVRAMLKRIRWTGRQTGRTREERLAALRGAFCVVGEVPKDARILLVDDLTTTGATLQECARTLQRAGATHVEGLVVAHG